MTVKILIADDQVLLSRALATILGSQPDLEVVATVHDGQAAVDTVVHTPVDLVLMDVRMPKLDGVAALKKIRARPNPPKIVMLTTFNVPDTVKAALTVGANGFLLKDADPETLIESVRTVAAGQTVLAADVVGHILPGALTVAADTLPSHVQQGLSLLTPREMEVLHAIGEGKTNAEIAAELVISATTVKTHVSNLLAKVHARDRVALAIIARKVGL
ncbi:MAG: response regulator [Corynebacterium matruchotii]